MAIKVRGKVLFVKSQTQNVILAFQDGTVLKDLEWFLLELRKDIELLAKESPAKRLKKSTPVDEEEEEVIIKKNLEALKARSDCKSAVWLPSRNEIRVMRTSDKAQKFFRVVGLNSAHQKCEGRGAEGLEPLYDEAVALAIEFLQGEAAPLLGEGPQDGGDSEAAPLHDQEPQGNHDDAPHDDGPRDAAGDEDVVRSA